MEEATWYMIKLMPDDIRDCDVHRRIKADFEVALQGRLLERFIAVFIGKVSLIGESTLYVPPIVASSTKSLLKQYEAFECDPPQLEDIASGGVFVGSHAAFFDYFR